MIINTQILPEKVITNLITYADVTKSITEVRTSFITNEVCIATKQQTIGITGIAAASDCTVQVHPVGVV